jgi:transcriptional regulator with XRE-family HTH domain
MRGILKLTQQQAADLVEITRQEWNRIEKGHHLPRPSNIPAIADLLGIAPAALFKKAGYAVPKEFEHYDMRQAQRDLEVALRNSATLVAFLVEMQLIWQEFQQAHTGKKQRLVMDIAYAEILANVLERFSVAQQLQLARDIVERVSPRIASASGINNQRFFDYIDKALAELSEQTEDENPPLLDNENSHIK